MIISDIEVLYSSADLHGAIKDILGSPVPGERRVALVAFVSSSSEAFLPDPEGLEIVCWLRPGATDDLALQRLQRAGAKLFKSEGLHTKVYWSSHKGCIICSANISLNALAGGAQKEVGVRLPAGAVEIDRLWKYATPKEVKPGDLKKLQVEADKLGVKEARRSATEPPPDFKEWYSCRTRKEWKLGWWDESADVAKNSIVQSKKSYGVKEPHNFLNVKSGQIKKSDWALTFRITDVTDIDWIHIDFVVEVDRSDKRAFNKDYPFQAVQVWPLKYHPRPPFKIDGAFQAAFKAAIKEYGDGQIEGWETLKPPEELIEKIAAKLGLLKK